MTFDAFVSYSRRDGAFADRLHRACERYKLPKGLGPQSGRLRLFRDAQDFTGSEYYQSIETHLASSRKLIVVCSPAAAASAYVDDEIDRFVRLHAAGDVVPVLWQGLPNNEATHEQAAERAFPPALCRALTMPLAADFRGFDPASGRIDSEAYRSAWTMLLANLLGVSRAEVEQRELKRRRAVRRAWSLGIGSVFAALLALTLWALFEGERALARQLAAEAAVPTGMDSEPVERRVLLARESALRLARLGEPTLAADIALRAALAHAPRRRFALGAGERLIAFAADGESLLTAQGAQLAVHAIDAATAARTLSLARPLKRLIASADSRYVAGIDDAGALRAWSWPDLVPIAEQPPEVAAAPVQCLAFSEQGATLVALRIQAGDARTVELLRWRLGEARLMETASVALPAAVRQMPDERCLFARDPASSVFHAVGAMLATASSEGEESTAIALRWPLQSSTSILLAAIKPQRIQFWPGAVTFDLDHNTAPVVLQAGGLVTRTRATEETHINVVPKWSHPVALSPGGAWLATAQHLEDPVVPLLKPTRFDLIDTSNGTVVRSVGDHAGIGAFSPDGETFATVSGKRIRLWDRRDGHERLRLQTAAPVQRLLFDPSSRQLAAVAADGALEVFAIGSADESLRVMAETPVEPLAGIYRAAIVSGSRVLLSSAIAGVKPHQLAVEGHIHSLAASPDGRWLVLGSSPQAPLIKLGDPPGSSMTLVELGQGGSVVRYRGPWGRFRFDRASRRLFVAGDDGRLRVIDLASAKALWTGPVETSLATAAPLGTARGSFAVADDGSAVAFGSGKGWVVLSAEDGTVLRRDDVPTTVVSLSADGTLAARAGDTGTIDVLRVADGLVQTRLDRRGVVGLRDLMFSPGARTLMAVGGTTFGTFFVGGLFAEEHFAVWDLRLGQRIARVPETRLALAEYESTIGAQGDERQQLTGLVWNAHTREIAGTMFPSLLAYFTVPSGMVRGGLMAWRLTDQGLIETYRSGTAESLRPRSMAAGGGAIVASSEDGGRRLIDLSGSRLVAESCKAMSRTLGAAERDAYLSGARRPMPCKQ